MRLISSNFTEVAFVGPVFGINTRASEQSDSVKSIWSVFSNSFANPKTSNPSLGTTLTNWDQGVNLSFDKSLQTGDPEAGFTEAEIIASDGGGGNSANGVGQAGAGFSV